MILNLLHKFTLEKRIVKFLYICHSIKELEKLDRIELNKRTSVKHLCVEKNGRVSCDRSKPDKWESFRIQQIEGKEDDFSIQSYHGNFLSPQQNGTIECNATGVSNQEMILISKNIQTGKQKKLPNPYTIVLEIHFQFKTDAFVT
jgi:hypothetical protein